MFSFHETYFRLVGIFDWEYARTQFLLSVSQNQYGFTLATEMKNMLPTLPLFKPSPLHFIKSPHIGILTSGGQRFFLHDSGCEAVKRVLVLPVMKARDT